MPLYELKCPNCKNEWDQFSSVNERYCHLCPKCEAKTGIVQISLSNPYVIKSGWNSDIEQHITGPKQYKEFLKDNHMEEVYGRVN